MGQEVSRGLLTGEARVRFQKLLVDKATLDDSASISLHQSICHQRSVPIDYHQDSTNTFTKQASVVKTLHIYIYIRFGTQSLRSFKVLSYVFQPLPTYAGITPRNTFKDQQMYFDFMDAILLHTLPFSLYRHFISSLVLVIWALILVLSAAGDVVGILVSNVFRPHAF